MEEARAQSLALNLPYVSALADDVLLLRDGDVMASFAVDGIGAATADAADVEALCAAFSSLVAQQMPDVGFAIHRISHRTMPSLVPVAEGVPVGGDEDVVGIVGDRPNFAEAIDRRWQDYLAVAGLRTRTTMVSITIRPSKVVGLFSRLGGGGRNAREEGLQRRIARLNQIVTAFTDTLGSAKPRRLTVSGGEWLGLLRCLVGGGFAPVVPGRTFTPLGDLIATSDVHFDRDAFSVWGTHSGDARIGAMVTLKDYHAATWPGVLDGLDLASDMVVTNTFTPGDRVEALAKIQRVARQMAAADDAAVSLRVQLEQAADDQASGRVAFGLHHATVAVFADTEEELDETLGLVTRTVTSAGGTVVRESFAARAAFFAQHPGNYGYRTRAAMISSRNVAELAALHGAAKGRPRSRSPWGEAVTVLPTGNGEPYRFNFHLAGERDERTVGHSLVLGQTGSGKTLGTAFLLAQAMRLNPRVIVFDKDRGLEMPIRAMGGSYTPVRMGEPTGFNPFEAESDERGAAWLTDWLEALLRPKDGELSPRQVEALARACQANREAPANLRTISHFRSQLRAVDDGRDLHTRLGRWDADGQFGWLFGGTGPDTLSFSSGDAGPVGSSAPVVAFDLSEIFDNPEVRTAWLSYVFRRIERTVEDERPTLIVMDEAWKLLDDPYFRSRLKDWMLTMRKKNVAVVLLTQRVSHLVDSAAGGAILESVATKLVYPSNRNTAHELAPLGLTDNEAAFLMQSNVGHRLALVQSGDDSTIVDMNLTALGPLVGVLGGGPGNNGGEAWPDGWRDDPSFWTRDRTPEGERR